MTNTQDKPDTDPAPQPANDDKPATGPDAAKKKTILLGKVKTDEEARLAAEIEKLRG